MMPIAPCSFTSTSSTTASLKFGSRRLRAATRSLPGASCRTAPRGGSPGAVRESLTARSGAEAASSTDTPTTTAPVLTHASTFTVPTSCSLADLAPAPPAPPCLRAELPNPFRLLAEPLGVLRRGIVDRRRLEGFERAACRRAGGPCQQRRHLGLAHRRER